jgi:hypothetical protein
MQDDGLEALPLELVRGLAGRQSNINMVSERSGGVDVRIRGVGWWMGAGGRGRGMGRRLVALTFCSVMPSFLFLKSHTLGSKQKLRVSAKRLTAREEGPRAFVVRSEGGADSHPLVQQRASKRLESPSGRGDGPKHAGEDVTLREHGNGVDEPGGSGGYGGGGSLKVWV